jgi:hypothetical protein
LVYGRDLRLPIEDDWTPKKTESKPLESDYDAHVRMLAQRLHEANKVAGLQSQLSHETAKRYYDRQAKYEKVEKGDLVYLHNPIFKRGKAKKFSYQYEGPYEVELRISPLIYKLRTREGTSIIVHINRLKRAYCKQSQEQKAGVKSRKQESRRQELNEEPSALESCEDTLDVNIPSSKTRLYGQTENVEIESSDDSEPEELLYPKGCWLDTEV